MKCEIDCFCAALPPTSNNNNDVARRREPNVSLLLLSNVECVGRPPSPQDRYLRTVDMRKNWLIMAQPIWMGRTHAVDHIFKINEILHNALWFYIYTIQFQRTLLLWKKFRFACFNAEITLHLSSLSAQQCLKHFVLVLAHIWYLCVCVRQLGCDLRASDQAWLNVEIEHILCSYFLGYFLFSSNTLRTPRRTSFGSPNCFGAFCHSHHYIDWKCIRCCCGEIVLFVVLHKKSTSACTN